MLTLASACSGRKDREFASRVDARYPLPRPFECDGPAYETAVRSADLIALRSEDLTAVGSADLIG